MCLKAVSGSGAGQERYWQDVHQVLLFHRPGRRQNCREFGADKENGAEAPGQAGADRREESAGEGIARLPQRVDVFDCSPPVAIPVRLNLRLYRPQVKQRRPDSMLNLILWSVSTTEEAIACHGKITLLKAD